MAAYCSVSRMVYSSRWKTAGAINRPVSGSTMKCRRYLTAKSVIWSARSHACERITEASAFSARDLTGTFENTDRRPAPASSSRCRFDLLCECFSGMR